MSMPVFSPGLDPQRIRLTPPKSVVLSGGANAGAVGTIALFTVTGLVLLESFHVFNTATFVSAGSGEMSFGTTGTPQGFSGAIESSQFTGGGGPPGYFIGQAGAAALLAVPAVHNRINISRDIIATVTTAAITAGAFDVYVRWVPISPGANLVAA